MSDRPHSEYVDARSLTAEYRRDRCPEEGVERWFKLSENEHERHYWYCQTCGNHLRHDLEFPCPNCDVRMVLDGNVFECRNEDCPASGTAFAKDDAVDRLSSDAYTVQGKPGALMGECPFCGAEHGVGGGPDGELDCSECREFYAGQYSDAWFCYAIWMRDPDRIRVRRDL